ncbi:MAG: polymerase ECF-type sigma factor [Chitinophagaceae bacterium]|nr:polymerase ECF-type sigma factor [Chitinophagaceae bacterium]
MTEPFATLPNEKELFTLVAGGDETAFAAIFHHYNRRLYPFVLKITKSEIAAEEIVQDIVTTLWVKRERLAEVDNYPSYIYRIATNKTFNWLKKVAAEDRMIKKVLQNMEMFRNLTDEIIDSKEKEAIINAAINELPAQRKLIYKLSRHDGLSHQQIAEKLDISPNTVKNQLVKALSYIRSKVETAYIILLVGLINNYFDKN